DAAPALAPMNLADHPSLITARRRPRSAPFPYTTLFRSATAATSNRRCKPASPTPKPPTPSCKSSQACNRRTARCWAGAWAPAARSEEHASDLQSRRELVCGLLPEKNNERKSGKDE